MSCRISALVTCAVLMFGVTASPADGPAGPTTKAIALIDDLEDGDLVGWSAPTGSCTAVNTAATGADGSSRSLEVAGECNHYGGVWYDLVDFPATAITFWVRPGSTSKHDTYVVIGDDLAATNNGIVFFFASASGYFILVGENSVPYLLAPYVADQWYRVDLTLDWVGRTIDVFIDGVPKQYNVSFRSTSTTTLTRFHFYNFQDSTSWLDYIVMSIPPPSLDIFADGFESADTTAWSLADPSMPARLVLFDGGGVSGAIGSRSGADVLCGQAAQIATGIPVNATTRAFLPFSAIDEIRDFPSRYGVPTDVRVTGPNWNIIADDWADLLDGTIDQSLRDAGAQTTTNFWYTGSSSDGAITPYTCSGWTNGSALFDGQYGATQVTDGRWLDTGQATCGLNAYHVLCLAWR